MKKAALLLLLAAACSQEREASQTPPPESAPTPAATAPTPVATEAPAGVYKPDKAHTSILFRVDHIGFSMYTARFLDFDATLELDPARPEAASLSATVEAASIETDYPDPQTVDFNAMLRGPEWLDAEAHPQMTFRSTSIEMTGADTARIAGDFTLRGVTRPIVLEAKFNGGYKGFAPYDPQARIGFSAHGALKRSEFGMVVGLPTPEFPIGVGDNVEIIVETELLGPPLPPEEAGGE